MSPAANETKPCPFCSEQIAMSAKKCRFCNEWLDRDAELEGRIRWDGDKLVLPIGAKLSEDSCWICGKDGPLLELTPKNFTYVPPVARFFGGIVVTMAFRKTATVGLPLCGPCRKQWLTATVSSVAFVILGIFALPIGLGFLGHVIARDDGAAIGVIVGIVGWIVGVILLSIIHVGRTQIKSTLIDEGTITLKLPYPDIVRAALKEGADA